MRLLQSIDVLKQDARTKFLVGCWSSPLQALILQSLSCLTSQQVTSVIPLYLVLFVTGIHFLHMFSWLVFLYPYLKLIFGHTCKISHYSDIVCHLHLLHKFL